MICYLTIPSQHFLLVYKISNISWLPSAKFMAPEKTRAANSPTLNPAAATHVSIACEQKCKICVMCQ